MVQAHGFDRKIAREFECGLITAHAAPCDAGLFIPVHQGFVVQLAKDASFRNIVERDQGL